MESPHGVNKRVKKVESKDAWESFVQQAKNQGCPIVVHFGASWCIPSVAMNPFFEELASTYPDVVFLYADVDDVKEVSSQFQVKAMPTFILIKNGAPADKLVGANPDEIRRRVDIFVQSTGGAYLA